jgi:hypothetical protein
MLGLAPFSGVPFSGFLIFSPTSTVSGLQANALLGSVTVANGQVIPITGLQATALLNSGASNTTHPVKWTTIDTTQYY